MGFTLQQLEDLEAALAEGVSMVSANGRQVSYRSISDMIKLRDQMREELGVTNAGRYRRYMSFRRD